MVVAGLGGLLWFRRPLAPTIHEAATTRRYLDPIFSQVKETSNLSYGPHLRHRLDLFEPMGDSLAKRPVVIVIHGGGFAEGSKEEVKPFARDFAKLGYVAIANNYRLTNYEYSINSPVLPQALAKAKEDAYAVVNWIWANAASYRLDKNNIFIGGYSAGAMTSLYAIFGQGGSRIKAAYSMAGAVRPADLGIITANDPPAILLHGQRDMIVPYAMAQRTYQAMVAAGIDGEWVSYPNVPHAVWIMPDAHTRVYQFFYHQLNLTGPSPSPSPSPSASPSPSPQPSPMPSFPPSQPNTGTSTWLTAGLILSILALTVARILLY